MVVKQMNTLLNVLTTTFLGGSLFAADLIPDSATGLRVTTGFRVTLVADMPLAPDIQCITFNKKGRLVVSGPGYIKTLVDTNNDSVYDKAELFASTTSGAMGLFF